jgi:hypothetical protein
VVCVYLVRSVEEPTKKTGRRSRNKRAPALRTHQIDNQKHLLSLVWKTWVSNGELWTWMEQLEDYHSTSRTHLGHLGKMKLIRQKLIAMAVHSQPWWWEWWMWREEILLRFKTIAWTSWASGNWVCIICLDFKKPRKTFWFKLSLDLYAICIWKKQMLILS